MTAEQINSIVHQLGLVASVLVPGSAPSIGAVIGVIDAATSLNAMVHDIKTNPDTAAVWAHVSANYASAADAFRASAERHRGQ